MTDSTAIQDATTTSQTAKVPFRVMKDFHTSLPQMSTEEYPGTKAFIADCYANPEDSSLYAGFFELNHTDAELDYFYDYDEMKVVLEGTFKLVSPDTGQEVYAGPKDAIFFPKGSRIIFSTEDRALAYYVRCTDLPD